MFVNKLLRENLHAVVVIADRFHLLEAVQDNLQAIVEVCPVAIIVHLQVELEQSCDVLIAVDVALQVERLFVVYESLGFPKGGLQTKFDDFVAVTFARAFADDGLCHVNFSKWTILFVFSFGFIFYHLRQFSFYLFTKRLTHECCRFNT